MDTPDSEALNTDEIPFHENTRALAPYFDFRMRDPMTTTNVGYDFLSLLQTDDN